MQETAASVGSLPGLEILRAIGRGSVAEVFLAREPALGRLVALKIVLPEVAADRIGRGRFEREGLAAARLTNSRVVQVHRVGETPDGRPFLVMEYVKGRNLEERLDAEGPLPLAEVRRILLDLSRALQWCTSTASCTATFAPRTSSRRKDPAASCSATSGWPPCSKAGRPARPADLDGTAPGRSALHHPRAAPRRAGHRPGRRLPARGSRAPPRKDGPRRPTAMDVVKRLTGASDDLAGLPGLGLIRRRVPHFVLGSIVAGYIFLDVISTFIQNAGLPPVSFYLAMSVAGHGILVASVLSWFHGARGKQKVQPMEVLLLTVIGLLPRRQRLDAALGGASLPP